MIAMQQENIQHVNRFFSGDKHAGLPVRDVEPLNSSHLQLSVILIGKSL